MKSYKSVDEYILNVKYGQDILIVLRELLHTTGLSETIKWGAPIYTFGDKNIVGLGSFKSYAGLWFFQGALLKDKANVLLNAQENITKAQRQWRFSSVDDIDDTLVLKYVHEAIENQKQGKEMKPDRNKPLVIPDELQNAFNESKLLAENFDRFTIGKKREFAEYISSAKQAETRKVRVKKIIPLILENIGLNDKYRK